MVRSSDSEQSESEDVQFENFQIPRNSLASLIERAMQENSDFRSSESSVDISSSVHD